MKRFVWNLLLIAVVVSLCLVVGYSEINVALAESAVSQQMDVDEINNVVRTEDGGAELQSCAPVQQYVVPNPIQHVGENDKMLYFENLYTYYPQNIVGSCTYVSLIQCLTYYDTFWNDDIIPENYEGCFVDKESWEGEYGVLKHSPGVKNASMTYKNYNGGSDDYDADNFRQYVQDYAGESYQLYLMKIKNDAENWSDETPYSMALTEWGQLVDMALTHVDVDYRFYNRQAYNIFVGPDDEVEVPEFTAAVISELAANNPVLLSMTPKASSGREKKHAAVAYHYDENGIYANMGWGHGSCKENVLDNYFITAAFVLDFSALEHEHSNNYIVNGVAYCGCRHSAEGHNFICDITNLGGGYHLETCLCGGTQTVAHSYTDEYISQGARLHNAYCKCREMTTDGHTFGYGYQSIGDVNTHLTWCVCGEQSTEGHNFDHGYDSLGVSEETHFRLCICGDGTLEPHDFITYEISGDKHRARCVCGRVRFEEHTYVLVDNEDDSGCKTYRCVCGKETTDEHVADSYLDQGMTSHTAICDCGYTYNEPHELVYAYVNSTHHSCTCQECGHTHNSVHAFQVGGLNKCIGCNKVITNPGGPGQIIHGIAGAQYVTANGSYILPNGCIMLVTEDIEAYFNGTLVFYDKDNPPLVA